MAIRILIAEDNPSVAAAVAGLLERNGFATSRAGDGVTALDLIVGTPPDLLLLDLKLPGLHGIELLKKLRQSPRTRELPVIITSGVYRGEKYARAARALGVDHYLEKPFRAGALLQAVRAVLKPPGAVVAPIRRRRNPIATSPGPDRAAARPGNHAGGHR